MTISTELTVIIILILFNGLLAMSEMAVVSSRKARLRKMAEEGNSGAAHALKLSESQGDFLASIQIGITLVGVLAGAFSGATLSEKSSKFVADTFPLLKDYANAIGLGLVVVSVTYLSLVLGELVPKKLALNHPEKIASRVSTFISLLGTALHPFVYLLSASTRLVLKMLGGGKAADQTITEEEVKILIEEGTEAGVFDKQEETMMKRVLKLDDYQVKDLMIPRTKVVGFNKDEALQIIMEKMLQFKHSYYPVFERTVEQPLGLLSIKSVLAKKLRGETIDLQQCMISPLLFPESLAVNDALENFRQSGKHIAFVIDEHGGFAGLIAVQDIAAAIMGDLPAVMMERERKIIKRDDGSLLVEGYLSFKELVDYLDIDDNSDNEFQTVGGLMMAKLGKIPTEGESIVLDGFKIEVVDMDRNRVDKVLIMPLQTEVPNSSI